MGSHESRLVPVTTPRAAPPPPPLDASPAVDRAFVAVLAGVTVLRLGAAAAIPLSGDEAYYWEYARHLALGYHDHPPMVAWLVALSTRLLGQSALTVRLPFILLGAAVPWLLFDVTRRATGSLRAAMWAGAMPLVVPLFTVAGMATFPDGPLLFATALFLALSWRAVHAASDAAWVGVGLAAGLAGLSKLTGLYLLPALFLLLLAHPPLRFWLRRPGPWLAGVVALAVMSPFIYWNATHGWDSVAYQYGSRLGASHGWDPRRAPVYLGFSAVALSPVLWVLLVWSTLRAGWIGFVRPHPDPRQREACAFFFALAIPIHALFFALSFKVKVGIHWTAPGTLAASCILGAWIDGAGKRMAAAVGVALAVAISGCVYVAAFSPATLLGAVSGGIHLAGINKGQQLSSAEVAEIVGYPEAARHLHAILEEERARGGDPFLISTNYTLSSVLAFYSGDDWHVIMGSRIGAEFDRWDDYPSLLGRDAIYVDTSPVPQREDVWQRLGQAFGRLEIDPPFPTRARGVGSRIFYVVRCRRFDHDVFTELKTSQRDAAAARTRSP